MSQSDIPEYGAPPVPPPGHYEEVQEPARLGPVQRFSGVMFSPGETFKDINRKPTWLIPLLISMVIAAGFTFFFEWRVKPDWDQLVRTETKKVLDRFGQPMPPEDEMQRAVARQKVIAQIRPIIGPLLFTFFLAGVFVLGMLVMAAQTTFKKILSVITWSAAVTSLVQSLVIAGSLMLRDEESLKIINVADPTTYSATSLAAVLPSDASGSLKLVASGVDIFSLWFLILLVIGFVAISGSKRITNGKAGFLVFGLWAIWLVILAGIGSMFA